MDNSGKHSTDTQPQYRSIWMVVFTHKKCIELYCSKIQPVTVFFAVVFRKEFCSGANQQIKHEVV